MARGWLLMLTWVIAWTQAVPSPSVSSQELVRKAVANELKTSDDEQDYMFQSRKQTPNGSQTRLYVQTKDAMAGVTVAFNDKPLTPEQRAAEDARNQRLISDPDALKRKQKQEKEDSDRVNRIVKALPDAFLYEPAGTTVGTAGVGKPGDELVQLKFRPNPDYAPPSRIEQVLTGMQGVLLIDANQLRIAQIDGTLFKDVGFGWGILGHLDHGGHFLVEQGSVCENGWAITHMSLSFTGRILLFKSLNIKSDEVYSEFRPVPADLTFAQGVELLKKHQVVVTESSLEK
jgi:hypothetical protein